MVLGFSVIDAMLVAMLIPASYLFMLSRSESRKDVEHAKKARKPVAAVITCSFLIAVSYNMIEYISTAFPGVGYAIGKAVLFVLLPLLFVYHLEGWDFRLIFRNLGISGKNISKSIGYGLAVLLVTLLTGVFLVSYSGFDVFSGIVLFFEAFNEEFFFRGFLLLYLLSKTNRTVAYSTSVSAFILAHPQNFASLFIITTAIQAIMFAYIAEKTGNITGPWISHGLNRFMLPLLKMAIS